jgi:serine/threonine-protein kinase PRP4
MRCPHPRAGETVTPEPAAFDLAKAADAGNAQSAVSAQAAQAGAAEQSAADYDPSMDRREDEQRRLRDDVPMAVDAEDVEVEEVTDDEDDDVDDMFALLEEKPKKTRKRVGAVRPPGGCGVGPRLTTSAEARGGARAPPRDARRGRGRGGLLLRHPRRAARRRALPGLLRARQGHVRDRRARARARRRAREGGRDQDYALPGVDVGTRVIGGRDDRLTRCPRVKAGHKEVQVLNKLMQADPEDKRHIVRLERTFEHRGHLCLVFESLRYAQPPFPRAAAHPRRPA